MQPLKIVHCANFSESKFGSVFYAMDRKISNGLIRNNHFVYDFSYRYIAKHNRTYWLKKSGIDTMNRCLIETCKNIQPQVLLLGHSELIHNETLIKIKENHPDIKIVMWWVDWIHNLHKITERLQLIDTFFITTNPDALKEVTENRLILSKCHYLPNMCDISIDRYKSFENKNYKYDILFMGRYDEERKDLINFIETSFPHLRVGLFGQDASSIVLGTDFFEKIYASKIAINFNRSNNISMYSSDRIIQLTANGAMTLSAEIPDMQTIFSTDEIAYFSDFSTLKEKVSYYLEHESERISLAKAGWKKAHGEYDSTTVTQYMMEKCFEKHQQTSASVNSYKKMAKIAFSMVNRYGSTWLFKPNSDTYETTYPQGKLTRLHGGGRADVYLFTHQNMPYCLKWFHDSRITSRLRNGLGFNKAQQSYETSKKLEELNVEAPRVLGVIKGNRFGAPLLIMEMLEGYQQMNLMFEEWKEATPNMEQLPLFQTLAKEFAIFCIKLEDNQVLHHDFSPRNVLVSREKESFKFCLIDLEDVYFGQNQSAIFAHFNERLPRYLTTTECSAFLDIFNLTLTKNRP